MLMNIIQYLLDLIQTLYQQNRWLLAFICRYIPLKQWAFDDSHSPRYQKFKVDQLPGSFITIRTGIGRSLTVITPGNTVNLSRPLSAAPPVTSRRIVPALPARLPSLTCTVTTAAMAS